jgi:hypothetical protein
MTFYANRDCSRAIFGFDRVPLQSRYRSIASLYTGACHVEGMRYALARQKLNESVPLPPQLEAYKRSMTVYVDDQLRRQGLGYSGMQAISSYYTPIPTYYESGSSKGMKDAKEESTLFTTTIRPTLSYTDKFSSRDNHGFNSSQSKSGATKLGADLNSQIQWGNFKTPKGPKFNLAFNLAGTSGKESKSSTSFAVSDIDTGYIYPQESIAPDVNTDAFEIKTVPEFGFNLSNSIDLSIKYEFYRVFKEFDSNKSGGHDQPGISFTANLSSLHLNLSYNHQSSNSNEVVSNIASIISGSLGVSMSKVQVKATVNYVSNEIMVEIPEDKLAEKFQSETTAGFNISATLGGGISATAEFNTRQIEPYSVKPFVDKSALSSNGAGLTLAMNIEYVDLSAKGTYTKFSQYGRANLSLSEEQKFDVTADGDEMSMTLSAKFMPTSWLSLSASYKLGNSIYEVGESDELIVQTFQKETSDSVSERIVTLSATTMF